jgi:ATP-dependent DNA helicase DinG
MKYEQQILESFNRLGFSPRPGQVSGVNDILCAFIDEGMRNVILNAPTGTGKSIIGAVVAETLSAIKHRGTLTAKSSISLTATNVLAKQYENTFDALMEDRRFIMIKGASNYECSALTTPEELETADACAWYTMVQNSSEFQQTLDTHCANCNYKNLKDMRNGVRHLTTNYSYYFIDRMYSGKFEDRDLIVWDEAHLVNDLFSEHNAIYFSKKIMQRTAQDIADTVQMTDLEIAKLIKTIGDDCGKKDKINEDNYKTYLQALLKIYGYAKTKGATQQERALRSGNMSKYTKLNRFVKEYEGKLCKIDDLFKYGYEHIFEYKEDENACSVKPIFVGNMMEALECGAHNLFMSATVSPELMQTTLKLDEKKTKFIKLPPTFAKENKEVVFFDPMSLNFTSLKDEATVKRLRSNVAKIVKKHVEDGERGIILTPSFKLTQEIAAEISKIKGYKLFEHKQGEKLEQILHAFKNYEGLAVLMSPSMYEGVDLPGDLSRFQIMVKAPFPSLGDKRMKFILDKHPSLYNTITIMKMVQGAGRSVRSVEDHAVTYMLDLNGQRLFNGVQNIWKDEFNIRFTKFI